jgi:hypothetical protein
MFLILLSFAIFNTYQGALYLNPSGVSFRFSWFLLTNLSNKGDIVVMGQWYPRSASLILTSVIVRGAAKNPSSRKAAI